MTTFAQFDINSQTKSNIYNRLQELCNNCTLQVSHIITLSELNNSNTHITSKTNTKTKKSMHTASCNTNKKQSLFPNDGVPDEANADVTQKNIIYSDMSCNIFSTYITSFYYYNSCK